MRTWNLIAPTFAAALLTAVPARAAPPTDAQNCEAAIETASGKFALCRLTAESKFSKTSDGAKLSAARVKCADKLSTAFAKAVSRFGVGDCNSLGASEFDAYLAQCSDAVAAAAGVGGSLPDYSGDLATCNASLGACNGALTSCDGALAAAQGNLSTCNASLSSAQSSLSTCNSGLVTCTGSLSTCNGDLTAALDSLSLCNSGLTACGASLSSTQDTLAAAEANLATCQGDLASCQAGVPQASLLRTGQTTCWNTAGTTIPCAGTGHDGDIQAGTTFAYTDNGDGTISDDRTGLMWEKLSDDGTIHDTDALYTWDNAFAVKIATLNSSNFAGHNDWRLPNKRELDSIINDQTFNPSTDAVFHTGCTPGCTVITCSCTRFAYYWTSSSVARDTTSAWTIVFGGGESTLSYKTSVQYVRAVRGGQ